MKKYFRHCYFLLLSTVDFKNIQIQFRPKKVNVFMRSKINSYTESGLKKSGQANILLSQIGVLIKFVLFRFIPCPYSKNLPVDLLRIE
jgi:hypothetical protein